MHDKMQKLISKKNRTYLPISVHKCVSYFENFRGLCVKGSPRTIYSYYIRTTRPLPNRLIIYIVLLFYDIIKRLIPLWSLNLLYFYAFVKLTI